MSLEKYISDLLFRYDCVIVPEFGGFLAQRTSAKYDTASHSFTPPSKELSFNAILNTNDGLLAHYISQVTNKNYEESLQFIHKEVEIWKNKLTLAEAIQLKNIGTLTLNAEGNIQFEPQHQVNYASDAYGLSSVKANPILIQEEKEVETPVIEINTPRFSWRKMAAASVLILGLISAGGYIATNPAQIEQYSSIFSFEEDVYTPDLSKFVSHDVALNPQPEDWSVDSLKVWAKNDSLHNLQIQKTVAVPKIDTVQTVKKVETITPVEVKKTVEKPTIATTSVAITPQKVVVPTPKKSLADVPTTSGNYKLMAGAFKNTANANKLVETLKKKGYTNAHIVNNGGLVGVAYGSYSSATEAQNAANSIRNNGEDVWIKSN